MPPKQVYVLALSSKDLMAPHFRTRIISWSGTSFPSCVQALGRQVPRTLRNVDRLYLHHSGCERRRLLFGRQAPAAGGLEELQRCRSCRRDTGETVKGFISGGTTVRTVQFAQYGNHSSSFSPQAFAVCDTMDLAV